MNCQHPCQGVGGSARGFNPARLIVSQDPIATERPAPPPRKYFEVQIKARSADVVPKNSGFFPQLKIAEPRRTYIFVLYAEGIGERGTYWVIPSTHFARPGFALVIKSGPRKGLHRISLNNDLRVHPKYAAYIDGWEAAFGKPPKPRPDLAKQDAGRRKAIAGLHSVRVK